MTIATSESTITDHEVWTGAVLRGPATQPLKTYSVTIEGDGRIGVALERAVQGV